MTYTLFRITKCHVKMELAFQIMFYFRTENATMYINKLIFLVEIYVCFIQSRIVYVKSDIRIIIMTIAVKMDKA